MAWQARDRFAMKPLLYEVGAAARFARLADALLRGARIANAAPA